VLLAALAGAPTQAGDSDASEILIGQSAALSGANARNGLFYSNGARLYFDAVNRAGGIFGRRLRLISMDDRGWPRLAQANTRKLIVDGGVIALFGYTGATSSKAALPMANQAGVPFFGPRSGIHGQGSYAGNRMLFTVRASQRDELSFLVAQLTAIGLRRLAIIHADDEAGHASIALAAQLLQASGGSLVAGVPMARSQTFGADAEEAADSLLRHRPDAVLIGSDAQSGAAVIHELRRRGYVGPFYGLSHLGPVSFRELLGEDSAGVAVAQTVPFPWRASSAIAAEYRKLAERHGDAVTFVGLEGFLAAKVLCEGLRRAGPQPTRQKLVLALESINDGNYDVGNFSLNFSAANHHGSRYVDMSAISRDGSFLN
jgi:ABC-type branched-subunit amino acid transport system substrate-binding protein